MPKAISNHLSRLGLLGASCLSLCVAAHAQQAIELDTVTIDAAQGTEADNGDARTTPGDGQGGGLETQGYVAKSTAVGTKTNTDPRKVPQSISTVSRQELEDRNVQTLVDAVRYKAGVNTGSFGFDPRFDVFNIRGFSVYENGIFRDGLRDIGAGFAFFKNEPYGIEGISILKGPSSVLYGGGSPGGIVNITTKRPTDAPFREIETQIGTNDRYQVNLDASGPLAGSDNVLYRLTGIARKADTDFAAVPDDRVYIAPALTLRSDDRNTHITFLGEYSKSTTGGASGFYSVGNQITPYEISDPRWGDFDQEQGRIGYEFEHRFNDTVTVRQNLRYAKIDAEPKYTQIDGISADSTTASRSAWLIKSPADTFAVDNQAELNFDTGAVKHTVLGGLDYNYIDTKTGYGFGPAPDLDLVNLNYGSQYIAPVTDLNLYNTATQQNQTGIYLQDQVEYESFVLTLGGRHDWLTTKTFDLLYNTGSTEQDDKKFSGRVGLSYLFDNGITPYVSYSTSFAPTLGRSTTGANFRPTEGEQKEIGIKYAPNDVNLSINTALFRIDQSNVLAVDPNGTNGSQIQIGEVRSDGFEIEMTTSLMLGLNLTASYTYLDLSIEAGNNAGNVPAGIPRNQFAVWSDYTVQSGAVEGLTFGGGVRFGGETWADDVNTFKNKDRTFVDAMVGYDFGKANPKLEGVYAQVNARNLFDKDKSLCNNGYCYRDEGRSVIGSLRYRF